MDFRDALRYILDGEAVLFLGTGFSRGARNFSGDELLNPSDLASFLYTEVGVPMDEQNGDLAQASDLYVEDNSPYKLVDLLKSLYSVSYITDSQRYIGLKRWRRIYTTNYDDVIEKSFEQNNRKLSSAVLSQKPSIFSNKEGMCIHLNGSIASLEPEKLGTEFKLTERSYLEDSFLKNEWISFFRSDLRTAKVVLFIGYSMKYDLDFKRIVFGIKGTTDKTFFVVANDESRINLRQLSKFGTPLTIGLDGLVNELKTLEKDYRPVRSLPPMFFSFDNIVVPTTPYPIQDTDVFKLFVDGEYDRDKVFYSISSPDDFPYYIHREKLIDLLRVIESGERNVLVHSDLGNGKTLFVNGLACHLASNGYRVFFYRRYEVSVEREVETICSSHEKTVIIIDGYADKFELLNTISRYRTDQIVILTERSTTLDITYEDVESILGEFLIYDVNRLSEADLKLVGKLFTSNGLWGNLSARRDDEKNFFLAYECHSQFREIVLKLLDSPDIKHRFETILSSIKNKEGYYEAIVFILVCQVCSIDLGIEQLASGLSVSKLNSPSFRNNDVVREFVDFEREIIRPKSSIVAEKLLQGIVNSELVVDVVVDIFRKLDSFHTQHEFAFILKKLLDYTHIQQFLNKSDSGYKKSLLRYYESLKTTSFCRENPDFWLQYAIVKISQSEFPQAKVYFETAYSFAKKRGQNPYRIDNHYARYLLEEQIKFGTQENCMIAFRQAHELLVDENRRGQKLYYPYRVAGNYYPFFNRFYEKMSPNEKQYFMACCRQMLDKVNRYLTETNTGNIVRSVRDAKSDLERILSIG